MDKKKMRKAVDEVVERFNDDGYLMERAAETLDDIIGDVMAELDLEDPDGELNEKFNIHIYITRARK